VFKKNGQGKYRPLPQERIDKLTELGFVWHAGFSRGCPSSATKATAGGSTPVLPSVAAAGSDGGGCVGVPVAGTIEAKNDNITKDSAESDDPGKASSALQHVPAASNGTLRRSTQSPKLPQNSSSEATDSSRATAVSPSSGKIIVSKRKRNLSREEHSGWDTRFDELVAYKKRHGHCRVPQRMPVLGRWGSTQRQQYKQLQSGKSTSMTNARLKRLESIGFVWDPLDDIWNMRFEQLKEYKAKHGNCMVPQEYAENKQL